LNRRYGQPLKEKEELPRFIRLVGGHPYLVRRGLLELSRKKLALAAFEEKAPRDDGIYGEHLRRILVLLARDAQLIETVRGILRGEPCADVESFYRLRSAGVMSGKTAEEMKPRCQLYASYLRRHLL